MRFGSVVVCVPIELYKWNYSLALNYRLQLQQQQHSVQILKPAHTHMQIDRTLSSEKIEWKC